MSTFSKREIAKRKRERRKEKEEKREARKSEARCTFEEMIAYVDQYGVITDTPPVVERKAVKIEDIEISIPPKTESDEISELRGRIEFYNETKGFGFIKDRDSVRKYFFHRSNVNGQIRENNTVTFTLERGPKGMNAVNVKMQ